MVASRGGAEAGAGQDWGRNQYGQKRRREKNQEKQMEAAAKFP